MTTPPIPADLLGPAPFSDEDLDATFAAADPDQPTLDLGDDPGPIRRWEIDGTGSAAWCMGKLAGAEADLRAVAEQAETWVAQIRAWQEHESRTAARRADFFRGHLEIWGLAQRAANPRQATITLPNGTVATRARKAQVVVSDAEWLTKFALDTANIHWLKMSPLVSKLREDCQIVPDPTDPERLAVVTRDGELVAGVEVEAEGFSVMVKPVV